MGRDGGDSGDPSNPDDRSDRPGSGAMERPRDFASDDPETGTVRTNDVETYYVRRGSGPPIVLVHGMAMSASQWDSQQRALADEFTTVAYDVRGHGRTGGSDRESYGMALYASDLHALLTSLDFDRPILCGLSMGGCIVQAYAAAYPDRVAGLVLADTFTAAPLPLAGRLVFANLRLFARLDRVVRYTTLNRVQTWVGERLAPGVAGDGETTQRLMEDAPTIPHAEFAKVARSVAAVPTSDLDASRITAPTLVLYGEHAPAFLRAIHAGVADRLENAPVDVVAVPDAGHASNVDNPAFFAEAVRSFARRMVAD